MQKHKTTTSRKIAIYLLKIISLAVIYHLGARVGLSMAYVQQNTSPVWPPTGIALAALLVFGIDLWPGITLGVTLGSLLPAGSTMQVTPWSITLGLAIGNTLEAVVGAYCLKRIIPFDNLMSRIRDVIGLAIFSMLSTTISATVGGLTLIFTGNGTWQYFGTIWFTWWIGDLLGALVIAPLILIWSSPPTLQQVKRRYLEAVMLFVILSSITGYVFLNKPILGIAEQALIYVIFPFIIWAALRFEQRGASGAIFLISGIAIWGTARGLGPYSRESLNDSLVLLQTFMAVVSLTSLILAAATLERHKADEELQQKIDDLGTLNYASRTFLGNFDRESTFPTICQLAVEHLGVNAAWIEILLSDEKTMKVMAYSGINLPEVNNVKKIWKEPSCPDQFSDDEETRKETADDAPPFISFQSEENSVLGFSTYAMFPLRFGGKSLGALKLLSKQKDYFTNDRQLLLQSYANLAAVAIQNTWLFDQVRLGNEQLHALSQRLMKAQEEERLHLSRELHDESGQLLAALMVQLGLLERENQKPDSLHAHVVKLKHFANEIQSNLHRLAMDLRPASLDHMGLVPALEQYMKDFIQQYHLDVEFESVGMQSRRLPIFMETVLFRIAQESLTNVVLHAKASCVDILLSCRNDQVVLIIEDNGIGFIPTDLTGLDHLGLFGIRERIEMLGGKLVVESSLGKGTMVRVEVPIHD
jgi:signal transduction histidine kinase